MFRNTIILLYCFHWITLSHLSLRILDHAIENGEALLSFPPHTTQMQPLDRSIYGPIKKFVNSAPDVCFKSHPGKTMTIYDIPSIVNQQLPNALTPKNIKYGFLVRGIWAFNIDVIYWWGFPALCRSWPSTSKIIKTLRFLDYQILKLSTRI
jgi:hypothetical protein